MGRGGGQRGLILFEHLWNEKVDLIEKKYNFAVICLFSFSGSGKVCNDIWRGGGRGLRWRAGYGDSLGRPA